MIDDTLFSILNYEELTKLHIYEDKIFQYLETNRVTLQSKLQRTDYGLPDKKVRVHLLNQSLV